MLVAFVVLLIGLAIIAGGIRLIRKANAEKLVQRKYEFENRSSGGSVQFDSFEESEAHQRRVQSSGLRAMWGLLGIGIGGVVVMLGFMLVMMDRAVNG